MSALFLATDSCRHLSGSSENLFPNKLACRLIVSEQWIQRTFQIIKDRKAFGARIIIEAIDIVTHGSFLVANFMLRLYEDNQQQSYLSIKIPVIVIRH